MERAKVVDEKAVDGWYQVQLPYAVFGLKTEDGVITEAAPIGSWMIGRWLGDVWTWVDAKGGKLLKVRNKGLTKRGS